MRLTITENPIQQSFQRTNNNNNKQCSSKQSNKSKKGSMYRAMRLHVDVSQMLSLPESDKEGLLPPATPAPQKTYQKMLQVPD